MPKKAIIYLIFRQQLADTPVKKGYGVVRDFVRHGIGTALHEAPEIPNYEMNRKGVRLKAE